jgi:transglutaminase-like putative cysteine protease
MRLKLRAELVYDFPTPTEVLASIEAAHSPDQTVLSESLSIGGEPELLRDLEEETGHRRFRALLEGETRILYEAMVDNGERPILPSQAHEHGWRELPQECLAYLLPSRFCPSDKFFRFARREFGGLTAGGAKVRAVLDWLSTYVDYVAGVSTPETTAERTFVDRAGVCRDFTHLGITLCRSLNIPARAVSAYAWKLEPPDFHAVFEVYLDGRWWLVDPSGLAPVEGMVRIATGRDAADIAFMTSSAVCQCRSMAVSVEAAEDSKAA